MLPGGLLGGDIVQGNPPRAAFQLSPLAVTLAVGGFHDGVDTLVPDGSHNGAVGSRTGANVERVGGNPAQKGNPNHE